MPAPRPGETLPTAARVLVGTSLRLLVRADQVSERAVGTAERLAALLPRPRRSFDEL